MLFELSSAVHEALLADAAAAHPHECCGLLFGSEEQIERREPATNVHPDPERHFEIDPHALIAAHRRAREGAVALVGYYHSHPNGLGQPSATDARHAAGDGMVWAIIAGGEVSLWRDETAFKPLPYRLVKP